MSNGDGDDDDGLYTEWGNLKEEARDFLFVK